MAAAAEPSFASHRRRSTTPTPRVVLHIDLDCFFCQVHELHDASLRGRPVALRQHDDVIAVNYAAKALGVVRHMAPRQAKQLLEPANGVLVKTPEEGEPHRVSYRIYREASESVEDALKEVLGGRGALEKGHGHDEFFVEATTECEGSIGLGADLAAQLRAQVRERCGLVASVGVARNKLVAKLVASMHKPDGLTVACTAAEMQLLQPPAGAAAVLEETAVRDASVSKLPGLGYKSIHGTALQRAGVERAGQLQQLGEAGIASLLGIGLPRARSFHRAALGLDDSPVTWSNPSSLSEQMSLVTQDTGPLRALPVGSEGAAERLSEFGRTMAARAAHNMARYGQYPTVLTLAASAVLGGTSGGHQLRSTSGEMRRPSDTTEQPLVQLLLRLMCDAPPRREPWSPETCRLSVGCVWLQGEAGQEGGLEQQAHPQPHLVVRRGDDTSRGQRKSALSHVDVSLRACACCGGCGGCGGWRGRSDCRCCGGAAAQARTACAQPAAASPTGA